MRITVFYAFVFLNLLIAQSSAQTKKYTIHTVAFYNVENLFDTINNANVRDDDWTPKGSRHWTSQRYNKKLENLAKVLTEIGTPENPNAPTFIGCAEIENRGVLEDLIKQPKLIDKEYGIIHFDSPDQRGIDVALLYQKKYFKPITYSNIPLIIYKNPTEKNSDTVINSKKRVFTRDQLLVSGFLDGEEISFIVNHWPSRSGGEQRSSPYRELAGALNRKIIDSLQRINSDAKVITMGDFNDGPYNKSIKISLGAKANKNEVNEFGIYNPFENMAKRGMGTIAYRDWWDIFDQILVSQSLIKSDFSSFQFWKAGIFNKSFLIQNSGKYKGYPLRHGSNEVGFSDHLPVYIYLIKEVK